MQNAPLSVRLIAATSFVPPPDVPWETDADGGQALVEFAGRACYQSWSKPNPRTATNAGYLNHLLAVGNYSVLEHASASVYVTGISRSCSHELIRHRHFSFSQLSQRSVSERDARMVVPPALEADPTLSDLFQNATDSSRAAYDALLTALEKVSGPDAPAVVAGKQARQAARSVLPNAVETRLVMTGNYRSWRHFVVMRASEHADLEIRRLAVECLRRLKDVAPDVFADFEIETLPDGTEVARSSYPGE
ncbi:FAD-dependent thymidylate synthase [Rhodococcus sp. MEB064]|uniref:FAD-dependent thymidylate synthase n=1 Tax=Rhodococcus sp. MEB064 TaxID=1587522 RepID=UPI0005AC0D59|nr:FAD-dependent thymidylate synthase [Rhodococcus sp. MEB064]KIQ20650.1 FAD-dependent thymidylate synthase [Rhodococcus sp. MEB064]